MVGADEFAALPEAPAPRALAPEVPTLPFVSGFDVREFFGLDPWPPRRPLNALQRARIATGLTQNELAAELGVCRQTVSSIENRKSLPTVRLALAIAISLGGTVEELFASDELR
jgi:putative transcriptional regulator